MRYARFQSKTHWSQIILIDKIWIRLVKIYGNYRVDQPASQTDGQGSIPFEWPKTNFAHGCGYTHYFDFRWQLSIYFCLSIIRSEIHIMEEQNKWGISSKFSWKEAINISGIQIIYISSIENADKVLKIFQTLYVTTISNIECLKRNFYILRCLKKLFIIY